MYRLALAFLILLAGCQQEMPPPAETLDETEIEAAITAIVDDMIQGADETDIERTFRASADNISMGNNGVLYGSKEEMLSAFGPGFEALESQDINMTSSHINVLSAEIATMSAKGVFTATDTAGVTFPERPFAWTMVFSKESGGWQLVQAHQSFGPPSQ